MSQYGEICRRRRRHKSLPARLKGLGEPVTLYVYAQNAQFFLGIFPGPQEGRVCAATLEFVATWIFPRHGDKWGQMLFVAH